MYPGLRMRRLQTCAHLYRPQVAMEPLADSFLRPIRRLSVSFSSATPRYETLLACYWRVNHRDVCQMPLCLTCIERTFNLFLG